MVAPANRYNKLGGLTLIPTADLSDAASAANVKTAGRLGDSGIGKRAGMVALRDNGDDTYDLVIASGDGATDPWFVILIDDGSAVTPA